MILTVVLAALAVLSLGLLAWQVVAASRFPVRQRPAAPAWHPPLLVLKPLRGCDEHTEACLQSWFEQDYPGELQILFGVAEASDPVCAIVNTLIRRFPARRAALVITPRSLGANAKISNVVQIYAHAQLGGLAPEAVVCLSDADVRVPRDLLAGAVIPLRDASVGLVNCFYQLANPQNLAMRVEAVAVNSDFWSQVLQSNTLKTQDFALGAVMLARAETIQEIGGFETLLDYLADDYQLGNRIASLGKAIQLAPAVVDCWDPPQSWKQVWAHQLRWARTIRVSQPIPYFFSILNNVTLWTTAFAVSAGSLGVYRIRPGYPWNVEWAWLACCLAGWLCCAAARFSAASHLVRRLTGSPLQAQDRFTPILKDSLQFAVWAAAFIGNTVTWRGRSFRIGKDGKLSPCAN